MDTLRRHKSKSDDELETTDRENEALDDSFVNLVATWDYNSAITENFKDTPLENLKTHVRKDHLKGYGLSEQYGRAVKMTESGIEMLCGAIPVTVDNIERKASCGFKVKASDSVGSYSVMATWDTKPPRKEQFWARRIRFTCSCDMFERIRKNDRYCKHIIYCLLMFFTND